MAARFRTSTQALLFGVLLNHLKSLGYSGALVERDYRYRDWFARDAQDREIPAALFGRTPIAYDTALIGVTVSNGTSGAALANSHRSLGAPLIMEVGDSTVDIWSVGATEDCTQRERGLSEPELRSWFAANEAELSPKEFLRLKNAKKGPIFIQGKLFAGLIPELEERIVESLDPLLRQAFNAGMKVYSESTGNNAPEERLFKLAFWILAGKVFADRRHKDFSDLSSSSDPDDVLERIGKHYNDSNTRLLNRQTRQAIFDRVWTKLDFRNLSVEVLSQIWSRTLVTPETRKRLGIHRTRRSIVEYITNRIPFGSFDQSALRVVEPCSGSATFLLGAMDRIRDVFPQGAPQKRHAYFQKVLSGFERDPFGAEISRLCLALADYPNPNGWKIEPGDVFSSASFEQSLSQARVVLCNPPFEDFDAEALKKYGTTLTHPPAALLLRVLDHLHPDGVLGFVLPRPFVDGRGYASARRRLAERFANIHIVALPDKGWDYADKETTLLIATEPVPHKASSVSYGVVREKQWAAFDLYHKLSNLDTVRKTEDCADESLAVPELRPVWEHVDYCQTLGDLAEIHKGLEWKNLTDNWDEFVGERPFVDARLGLAPREKEFWAYERPATAWLTIAEKHLYRPNAIRYPWASPKIIINKTAKGRGPWRLSAFADLDGLYCGETFLVVWPKDETDISTFTAILNSPIGNAFVTVHEGKIEFAVKTIKKIPVPKFSLKQKEQIAELTVSYQQAVRTESERVVADFSNADRILREIDAAVLSAYKLPPKLERRLLDFFREDKRKVPFPFKDYFPPEFKPCFSLADWLTGRHSKATVGRFRAQTRELPEHIAKAIRNVE